MATVNHELMVTLPAAADYSTTGQYRFVTVNTDGEAALIASAGVDAIGVLSNNPGSKQAGRVVFGGKTKVILGATVAAGAKVATDNAGRAVTASGNHVLGKCLKGGDIGEIGEILLVSKHILA